jgi:outer membrane protein insertion porin family
VTVEEGRPYRFGAVTWSGNTVLPTATLERFWAEQKAGLIARLRGGDAARRGAYDVSRIERAQGLAYAEYAEHGYLYLGVEPRETLRDSVVDVGFVVTEGQPSNIRYIQISGNRGTREKVIRREIDIHEGEKFRRSRLVRTQGDIFRLGLFEDEQEDYTAAESTDVDIHLKVKEKQVGTASAGAGYTSESGVTGFLELGHNNVLGNGQSLQLHLERGGKREDYYVSFTEPWFRDTPTLLGFTVFKSTRDRSAGDISVDAYRETRVGGSGRIGRPLPWPDYARGSVSYQLEQVTIDSLGTLSTTDRVALTGIPFGRGLFTSSLQTVFLRNSTDNPFYPTRGTRLTVNDEFAGGLFGGSVNFHKHRFEERLYLPSLMRGLTTMVRARVGLLGEYGDQNLELPRYERFRLGGGSTPDPLRGYDDYQVVPEKFDYVRRDTLDKLAPYDSVYASRIRYPGGRTLLLYSVEQQFPIVHPLHGVIFFDAGNTWDLWREIRPLDLKLGAGLGFRMEIPLIGNIGFDYGYGFDRDDGPRWAGHFLLGNVNF